MVDGPSVRASVTSSLGRELFQDDAVRPAFDTHARLYIAVAVLCSTGTPPIRRPGASARAQLQAPGSPIRPAHALVTDAAARARPPRAAAALSMYIFYRIP